ncbi:MAG TPA: T9SS type A sorting domain-containing protein [Bacteroidota bacterium]
MKQIVVIVATISVFPVIVHCQSIVEFQAGTTIEVQAGADICADSIAINGSYTGAGTKCGGPLPVEFVSLTDQTTKNAVTLQWTTATETNTTGFEVERKSTTGTAWEKVGAVAGSGSSSSTKHYTFTDELVPPGRYEYRIKQLGSDGSVSYTPSVEAEVGLAPKVFTLSQNYPNPFNPTTTIEFTLAHDGRVILKIFDITGREVETLLDEQRSAGFYEQVTFDASRLGSGTYFYRLESAGNVLTRKMVLLK